MPELSFLLVCPSARPEIAESVRRSFPGVTVDEHLNADLAGPPYHVIIVLAERNADFAQIRRLRKFWSTLPLVAISERDRSGAAYMAGANEFASCYDADGIMSAVRRALEFARPETKEPPVVAAGDVSGPSAA